MSIGTHDFYLLGMNIGRNEKDYTLLHKPVEVKKSETLKSLWADYQSVLSEKKGAIEQKLFFVLLNESSVNWDPSDQDFGIFLFTNGLDVLESHLEEPACNELIITQSATLFKVLNERIKDKLGITQFNALYPTLSQYLKENFGKKFESFNSCLLEQLISSKNPSLTPLERQLQRIKDRLAENFFTKAMTSLHKPSVIALQEVYELNNGILKILTGENYAILKSGDSDTAIAVDSLRFESIKDCSSKDNCVVFAQDKKTKEEYIFISTHLPGYQLEYPVNASQTIINNLNRTIEGSMESGSYAAILRLNESIEKLKTEYPNAHVVIQGDFNTNPKFFKNENLSEKIKKMNIFSFLKKNNLTLMETNHSTELNQQVKDLQEREIDFVVISHSLKGHVHYVSIEDQELTLAKIHGEEVEFDPTLLFSDHIPLWVEFN